MNESTQKGGQERNRGRGRRKRFTDYGLPENWYQELRKDLEELEALRKAVHAGKRFYDSPTGGKGEILDAVTIRQGLEKAFEHQGVLLAIRLGSSCDPMVPAEIAPECVLLEESHKATQMGRKITETATNLVDACLKARQDFWSP